MFFDIFALIILIIMAIWGFKSGFAKTISHFGGWIVAILIAVFCFQYLKDFLMEYTSLDEYFYRNIYTGLQGKSAETINQIVPDFFKETATSAGNSIASTSALGLTSLIMSIFSFLAIIILVKLLTWFFMRLFSKKHRMGTIGAIDGLLGLVFGIIKGIVVVLILYVLLLPILVSSFEWAATLFTNNYQDSFVITWLYESNIFSSFAQDLPFKKQTLQTNK